MARKTIIWKECDLCKAEGKDEPYIETGWTTLTLPFSFQAAFQQNSPRLSWGRRETEVCEKCKEKIGALVQELKV